MLLAVKSADKMDCVLKIGRDLTVLFKIKSNFEEVLKYLNLDCYLGWKSMLELSSCDDKLVKHKKLTLFSTFSKL